MENKGEKIIANYDIDSQKIEEVIKDIKEDGEVNAYVKSYTEPYKWAEQDDSKEFIEDSINKMITYTEKLTDVFISCYLGSVNSAEYDSIYDSLTSDYKKYNELLKYCLDFAGIYYLDEERKELLRLYSTLEECKKVLDDGYGSAKLYGEYLYNDSLANNKGKTKKIERSPKHGRK